MERREQEVARSVAGEDAAGPVAAVGGRREAQQEDPRLRVTEARHGPAPVGLVAEARHLLAGDAFAPLDQARAPTARDDLVGERGDPVAHFSSSRSNRRETTASPMIPITDRYSTWTSRIGLIAPTVSERMRSTPWYSGVSRTTTCSTGG